MAVAVPNLDELLEGTPTHVFASVWFDWRKTKYYPLHYSELIRLAALYKLVFFFKKKQQSGLGNNITFDFHTC